MVFSEYLRCVFSKYKNRIAIRCHDIQYTYEYLNHISEIIAQNIVNKGIQPGSRIGLYFDRSPEALFVLCGIIKANCIYAPLSKNNPPLRTQKMLQTADIKFIISDTYVNFPECSLFCFQDMIVKPHVIPSKLPKKVPENQALYTIFTSGTTGFPKAFDIRAEGILNLVSSLTEIYFGEDNEKYTVIGELAELVFDVSQGQIFLAFLNGKTLQIIPDDIKTNPRKLSEYLTTYRIMQCDITPTLLKAFYETCQRNQTFPDYPKIWASSGERIPMKLVKDVIRDSELRIANSYGPAETCVYVSVYMFDKSNASQHIHTPIGVPIHNTRIRILNTEGEEVPAGKEGEITVCGIGVTEGYIHQLAANEKAFFYEKDQSRWYKTGDLGFYCPENGQLYCLGRIDFQVKYHGIRVELDEIRWIMNQMEHIIDSYPFVHKTDDSSDLVVYYISNCQLKVSDMTAHLRQYLPSSLLPNYYIRMDSFPISVSGKTDIKAFPPYKNREAKLINTEILDPMESEMLSVIKEILSLESVSVNDNFNSLGGDSMDIITFLARIEEKWNLDISYHKLVECETFSEMFRYIKSCPTFQKESENAKCQTFVPVQAFQAEIIRAEKRDSDYPSHNIIQCITVSQYLSPEQLKDAVCAEVYSQDALRCFIRRKQYDYYLELNENVNGCFQYYQTDSLEEKVLRRYIKNIPYDSGVLIRFMLFETSDHRQSIILNVHHSVFDYVSVRTFFKRVLKRYLHEPVTPNRSYLSYISEQRTLSKEKKAFWKRYYMNRENPISFPCDKREGNEISLKKTEIRIENDQFLSINAAAQKEEVTLYHVFMAIWFSILFRATECKDMIIGSFFPGRIHVSHSMTGLFTSCLGVRIQMKYPESVRDIAQKVKSSCAQISAYQDTSLADAMRCMQLEDIRKGSLFHFLLNYHSCLDFSINSAQKAIHVQIDDWGNEEIMYPLYASVFEKKDSLRMDLWYDASKYSDKYIAELIDQFHESVQSFLQ